MAGANHEDEIATTSNKMVFYAGVLSLVVKVFSLIPRFLLPGFRSGGAPASPVNAFLYVNALLMAACYLFLIRSRVKGAKWILILLVFSVFDTFLRFVGYQHFPIMYYRFFRNFWSVAGFAVFMNLAIRNKGGLRIAFGALVFASFVSILTAVWWWGWWDFFKPMGGPSAKMVMCLRLIGLMPSFFSLFGWMYLLHVAQGNRATGEESAAEVPWPWRVLVAFFPELLLLFFCGSANALGIFAFALVGFTFGAGGPFGWAGMILGGLAYFGFAILVLRCKRWASFYRLIGCGFALLIVNAIGLVVLPKRHF